MNLTEIPFNRFVGLVPAPPQAEGLLSLPEDAKYHNHLGTVHAGALLILAEASSA